MQIKATGADPLFIVVAVWAGCTQDPLWFLVLPLIVASWVLEPRWDKENGWRFLH